LIWSAKAIWFTAETLANSGVKVISVWAVVWCALAFAVVGVEVEIARTFLFHTEASAVCWVQHVGEELLSSWACDGCALTVAALVVE
jgi:hypothetical protein